MEPETEEKAEEKLTQWRFAVMISCNGALRKFSTIDMSFTNAEDGIRLETLDIVSETILKDQPSGYDVIVMSWSKILEASDEAETDEHQKDET